MSKIMGDIFFKEEGKSWEDAGEGIKRQITGL